MFRLLLERKPMSNLQNDIIDEAKAEEIEEVMDKAEELSEPKYEFELFLSTDGKQTVHVKAFDAAGKRKALTVATETYDYILARYGTKQNLNKETYNATAIEAKIDPTTCPHTNVKFVQAHTPKNEGRWFKTCVDCKKFISWQ